VVEKTLIEKLAMNIDLQKGNIILGGRFKNQRMKVKSFGTDDLGQPTVNKRKMLTFRIEKTMPENKKSSVTRELNKQAFDAIRNKAFLDEIEKLSVCKSYKGVKLKKAKQIEKVAYSRVSVPLMAGLIAYGLGSEIFDTIAQDEIKKIAPKFSKEMKKSTSPIDYLRSEVKRLHPEVSIITKDEELKKMKGVNILRKIILRLNTPVEDNAMYSGSKKTPIVILPDTGKVNKYVFGHELGHHRWHKTRQDDGFFKKVRGVFEPVLKEEYGAWNLSPYAGEKGEKRIKNLALKTYIADNTANKRSNAVALATAVPAAALVNYDLIVDAVKNLRKIVKK